MRNFGAQLDQIQLLIDRIQNRLHHQRQVNQTDCDKLLQLSEQFDYTYGQAMAHVHLVKIFQMKQDEDAYHFHSEQANEIAKRKNYFDVQMIYLQQEGMHSFGLGNEMKALTIYLSGLKIAREVKEQRVCATFHNLIAEIFCEAGAFHEAEECCQLALDAIEHTTISSAQMQRKETIIRLMHLAILQKNVAQAKQYRAMGIAIECESSILDFLLMEEDIRVALLEGDIAQAEQLSEQLIVQLMANNDETSLLLKVYLYLMELLLQLKKKEHTTWCMNQIDRLYQTVSPHFALQIQKLRIWYTEEMGLESDDCYAGFYHAITAGDLANRASMAEGFQSMITLYETAKEDNRLMEERETLQTLVEVDELTKVYNRRHYSKLISKLLQDDRVQTLGYMMVDVDFFKEYNDHYGHIKGDGVLKDVAAILKKNLPADAYVARYGGDEFSCLFVNRGDDEIVAFIQQVQKMLSDKKIEHLKSHDSPWVSLSFGVYNTTQPDLCDESELMDKADQALYQSKREGRNRYTFYLPWRQT